MELKQKVNNEIIENNKKSLEAITKNHDEITEKQEYDIKKHYEKTSDNNSKNSKNSKNDSCKLTTYINLNKLNLSNNIILPQNKNNSTLSLNKSEKSESKSKQYIKTLY